MGRSSFHTIAFIVAMGFVLAACKVDVIPTPTPCPPLPTPADWGPIPPANGQSSVDIELSRHYITERIRTMLESSQSGESGVFVRSVTLKQVANSGNSLSNLVEIRVEPWLRGTSGQPASLQRSYRLSFRITPHVITPTTVPDQNRRKELLCPSSNRNCAAEQGATLSFDLVEVYNVSFSRTACDSPDHIDSQIVPIIYEKSAVQKPLLLPTESIATVLRSAARVSPNLMDVNVGSDGFLKIGLQYDIASTHNFFTIVDLMGRYPGSDWFVDIDTSILSSAVSSRMLSELRKQAPGSTMTSFSASFSPGEIRAIGVASVAVPGICGSTAELIIEARNPTQICRNSSGKSVLASWIDASPSTSNFCINFKRFWDSIGVGIISGPPAIWPTLATVDFEVGDNDVFYGTHLDLDNAFGIAGRSTLMDRKHAADGTSRPTMPANCPGVP